MLEYLYYNREEGIKKLRENGLIVMYGGLCSDIAATNSQLTEILHYVNDKMNKEEKVHNRAEV